MAEAVKQELKAGKQATTKSEAKKDAVPSFEEKVYTIPLQDAWNAKFKRRSKKAISVIQQFAQRPLKAESVRIGNALNESIWAKGAKYPPRKLTVKAVVREGVAWVDMPDAEWQFLKTEAQKKEKLEELKKQVEEAAKKGAEKAHDQKEEKTEEEKKEDKKVTKLAEEAALKGKSAQLKKEAKKTKPSAAKSSVKENINEPEHVKG